MNHAAWCTSHGVKLQLASSSPLGCASSSRSANRPGSSSAKSCSEAASSSRPACSLTASPSSSPCRAFPHQLDRWLRSLLAKPLAVLVPETARGTVCRSGQKWLCCRLPTVLFKVNTGTHVKCSVDREDASSLCCSPNLSLGQISPYALSGVSSTV